MSEEKEAARLRLEGNVLSAVADFMGVAVGMRPPVDRHLFPPTMESALAQLVDDLREVFGLPQVKRDPPPPPPPVAPVPAPRAAMPAAKPADRK